MDRSPPDLHKHFFRNPYSHIAFWSAFIFYELLTVYIHAGELDPVYDYAGHYALNISFFYWTAYRALPGWKGSKPWTGPLLTLSGIAGYLILRIGLLRLFTALGLPYYNPYHSLPSLLVLACWRGLSFFNMGLFYWLLVRHMDKLDQLGQLRILKLENEKSIVELQLAKIQSQVNPHFLFNTLNLIHSRALRGLGNVADIIVILADILEHTFKKADSDGKIMLADEIRQIELYTELNRLKYGVDFNLEIQIVGKAEDKRIPPILLVSIIENLFKHGDLRHEQAAAIALIIGQDELNFRTYNRKAAARNIKSNKTGMVALQQRLDLYYPGNYHLFIDEDDQAFELRLHLQL